MSSSRGGRMAVRIKLRVKLVRAGKTGNNITRH